MTRSGCEFRAVSPPWLPVEAEVESEAQELQLEDFEELVLSEVEKQDGWAAAFDSDDDMIRTYGSTQGMRLVLFSFLISKLY